MKLNENKFLYLCQLSVFIFVLFSIFVCSLHFKFFIEIQPVFLMGVFCLAFFFPIFGSFFLKVNPKGLIRKIFFSILFVSLIWVINGLILLALLSAGWDPGAENQAVFSGGKGVTDEQALKEVRQKVNGLNSLPAAEAYVRTLILKRKENKFEYSADVSAEETQLLIDRLSKIENRIGFEKTAELYLELMQYSGASDGENLNYLYKKILYEHTAESVMAMIEVVDQLLPEFKNETFIKSLYAEGCGLPEDLDERTDVNKLKDNFKAKLKSIENSKNGVYVEYLLKNNCF